MNNIVRIENIELEPSTLELRFLKTFTQEELELAKCLNFTIRYNEVTADLRKTSKNAVFAFMKKALPYFTFHESYGEHRKILYANIKAAYNFIEERFTNSIKERIRWSNDLLKHQSETIMYSLMRKHNLVALDQGLGKSLCAITVNEMLKKDSSSRALVVAPAACKWNWLEEFVNWGFDYKEISVVDSKNNHNGYRGRIMIINYDLLNQYKNLIINLGFDHIILDEAHKIKNKDAIRSQAMNHIQSALNAKLTFLSGTPAPNTVEDIFVYLSMSGHYWGQDESAFRKRFFKKEDGKLVPVDMDYLYACMSNFMIRKLKDETLSLPSKSYKRIKIPFDNLREEYEQAYKELECKLEAEGKKVNIETVHQRLNVITAKAKLSGVCEIMDGIVSKKHKVLKLGYKKKNGIAPCVSDYEEANSKVVLFTVNTEPLRILKEIYGDSCRVIDGSVAPRKRLEIVNEFKSSRTVNYLFCNTTAAGIGLNILNNASQEDKVPICDVVHLSLPYTNAEVEQANDRVHRIGQYVDVTIYLPFLENSIDERIYNIISKKYKYTSELVEGKQEDLQFTDVDDLLVKAFSDLIEEKEQEYEKSISS